MKELPLSIGVISFVAGLVLLIAAIAGQKIEIAAVKLPEIVDSKRRFVVGALGAVLIGFGMWDGTLPAFLRPSTAGAAAQATAALAAATSLPGGSAATPGLLACLADAMKYIFGLFPQSLRQRESGKIVSRQRLVGLDAHAFQHGHELPAVLGGMPRDALEYFVRDRIAVVGL